MGDEEDREKEEEKEGLEGEEEGMEAEGEGEAEAECIEEEGDGDVDAEGEGESLEGTDGAEGVGEDTKQKSSNAHSTHMETDKNDEVKAEEDVLRNSKRKRDGEEVSLVPHIFLDVKLEICD